MSQPILVVDDPRGSLAHVAEELGARGYGTLLCSEAEDPVAQFGATPFDLVIVSLACHDPMTVCNGIRDFPEGAITPVIFIGDGSQAICSPADALGAGGDYYFEHPVDTARLAARVQTYVGAPQGVPSRRPAAAPPPPPDPLAGAADLMLAQITHREQEIAREQESARWLAEQDTLATPSPAPPPPATPTTPTPEPVRPPRPTRSEPAAPIPLDLDDEITVAEARPARGGRTAMVLTPPQPLRPASGALSASYDIAALFADVIGQEVTGRLDLIQGQRQKTVFLQGGIPVDAYSSQIFDRIEEYLLREGKITRPQYQSARIKRLRSARQVGAFLVTESHMKPEELFGAVRGHLEELYFSLFEWEEGTFRYTPEQADESDRVVLDVGPHSLLLEGIRRKYMLPRLIGKVGSLSSLLAPVEAGADVVEALGLSAGEATVVRLLDGTRNIEDLVFSSGLDALRVYHVLFALVSLGAAEIKVRGIEGVHSGNDANVDAIDRERIREKAEQARNLDYFQILGIGRGATPYEIERAWQRHCQDFGKARFSAGVQTELAAELEEIAEVLADARGVLGSDDIRASYARHLTAGA